MDQCDVLLFVATKTEREELERAACARGASFEPIPVREGESKLPGESYWLGAIGDHRVIAVKTRMGAIGDGGSAALGLHYVRAKRATSVICIGMAFGISAKFQAFGDVLVSESIFPYDLRTIVPDGDRWRYDYDNDYARTYKANPTTLAMLEAYRPRVTEFKVHPGCLLSGNAFIRSASFRDDLLRWSQNVASKVVGGDMEGAGLLALAPRARPNWTVVKGICDSRVTTKGRMLKSIARRHAQTPLVSCWTRWLSGRRVHRDDRLHGEDQCRSRSFLIAPRLNRCLRT